MVYIYQYYTTYIYIYIIYIYIYYIYTICLEVAHDTECSNATEIQWSWSLYIYAVKKGDNMPSRLMPINQLSHNNSCTWAHMMYVCTSLVPKN